jgi:hypothetical protein
MPDQDWIALREELDRWREAGKVADFWLRDDDAVAPTAPLSKLIDLGGRHAVPVTLAVIPQGTGAALADFLDTKPGVDVALHGWSHANHAGPNEKKQELGAQRPASDVLAELAAGFGKLQALHPGRFTATLVPPWNRIASPLVPELAGLGIRALSVFGPEKPAPVPLVNTHVDLMDWHGTRGARPPAALVADIVVRLRQMSRSGGVMGFLTHHLVHDDAGWDFLETLFAVTQAHPAARWQSLTDVLAEIG